MKATRKSPEPLPPPAEIKPLIALRHGGNLSSEERTKIAQHAGRRRWEAIPPHLRSAQLKKIAAQGAGRPPKA